MRKWLTNLSDRQETILVLCIAFGASIFTSLWYVFNPQVEIQFDNASLLFVVVEECVLLAVIWMILETRGWQIRDHVDRFRSSHVLMGIGLGFASYLLYGALYILLASALPSHWLSSTGVEVGSLAFPIVILISVVNPIFEEFIVVAFVFSSAEKWTSPTTALNISVGVRLAYHLYQGPIGIVFIVPMGLLFGLVYLRWRNIWPLVIAHGLMDLVGFGMAQIAN